MADLCTRYSLQQSPRKPRRLESVTFIIEQVLKTSLVFIRFAAFTV